MATKNMILPMNDKNVWINYKSDTYVHEVSVTRETYFYVIDDAQRAQYPYKHWSLYEALKHKPKGGLIGLVLEDKDKGILSISDLIDAFDIKCGKIEIFIDCKGHWIPLL